MLKIYNGCKENKEVYAKCNVKKINKELNLILLPLGL
jgi:hypothetical protein